MQTLTTLSSFNGTDGSTPYGSLTLSGSTLYGMTYAGGTYTSGTVFSIPTTGGTPTVLDSLNYTDGTVGGFPHGSLTLSGSTLYGVTNTGAGYGYGGVFSIPTSGGSPTVLTSFHIGTTGDSPTALRRSAPMARRCMDEHAPAHRLEVMAASSASRPPVALRRSWQLSTAPMVSIPNQA